MTKYIWEETAWPGFIWDYSRVTTLLGEVRNMQGRLSGQMHSSTSDLRDKAFLDSLTEDVVKSWEIEGEKLDMEQVRSSVARHLGIDIARPAGSARNVDGIVEMMLDAVQNYDKPLDRERLFGWHSALFPSGRSGISRITAGEWRKDQRGPMLVVSGAIGKEKIHFEAPPAAIVESEMAKFIEWFNSVNGIDQVLKAVIAHLWFVTIHPFADGNGRIARALTDMLLTRSEENPHRFYSMSAAIMTERKDYYIILEKTQKSGLDITGWMEWFLNCLLKAMKHGESMLAQVMRKALFWNRNSGMDLNGRQRLMLNRLLDGFEVKLTTSKWARISKCSPDSALRDIQDLISKGILTRDKAGGRSTNYKLK